MLHRRPRLRLLLLLSLLPWPVTRAQTTPDAPGVPEALATTSAMTTPGIPSGPITPGISSTQSLRERAQALMRDFSLVDGCVGVMWRPVGAELTLRQARGSRACRAGQEAPLSTIIMCPFPHYSVPGGIHTHTNAKVIIRRSPYCLGEVGWDKTGPGMLTYPRAMSSL